MTPTQKELSDNQMADAFMSIFGMKRAKVLQSDKFKQAKKEGKQREVMKKGKVASHDT